jgi:hypothetical protein
MRQASLLVADEATLTLSGKLNIFGIYPTDITILSDPTSARQLVFAFFVETDPDDPFQRLELHVALPGGDERHMIVSLPSLRDGQADKIRWSLKFPLLFQNPRLKPGPIKATVTHEKGILTPAAPVIVLGASSPSVAPEQP